MKKVFEIWFLPMFVFVLYSCGYDDFDELPIHAESTLVPNTTVSMLRSAYYGTIGIIGDDVLIDGTVTANDRSGNFYKTFMVQDASGAVEVCAGLYDLYNIYRVGQRVKLSLKGCAMGEYNGVLRVGLKPDGWRADKPNYFGSRVVMDKYVFRDGGIVEPVVKTVDADDLTANDCGMLVRVENVVLADFQNNTWCTVDKDNPYAASVSTRMFLTRSGEKLYVATSIYADFAARTIPDASLNLTGILQYGKFDLSDNVFAIVLRDIEDVEEN